MGQKFLFYPSYLTNTVHLLYWNSRTWSTSDFNVQSERRHYVIIFLSVFRDFLIHNSANGEPKPLSV